MSQSDNHVVLKSPENLVIDRRVLHPERITKKVGDRVKLGDKEGVVYKIGRFGVSESVSVKWDDGSLCDYIGKEYNKITV